MFTLKVGDCLNDINSTTVSDVPLVDCAAPHDLEVYDDFSLTDTSWNPVALSSEADDGCKSRFVAFTGIAYDTSALDVTSYTPTVLSWNSGDRLISCMVGDPAGKSVGTLRGSGR